MKKLFTVMMLLSQVSFAQFNLVPNPSFEIFDTCPFFAGQIRFAPPWTNPLVNTTPDYFNACDTTPLHQLDVPDNYLGFQHARSGLAYADVVTSNFPLNQAAWNAREYLQVELTDFLIAGTDYCIRWYVSACDSCHYISNNMGMYFSSNAIQDTCPGCIMPLPVVPQFENPLTNNLNDRFGWTEISGIYTASGGEKFIIIGNFHDTASTVATYTGWSQPGTYYWHSVYFIDDVMVTPCDSLTAIDEKQFKNKIEIIPNPFQSYIKIDAGKEMIQIVSISTVTGNLVFDKKDISSKNITIELENLLKGIYLVKLTTSKFQYNFKIIKN